jgi:hypothetical protein
MGRAIAVRTDYTAGEVRRRGGINKVLPGADHKQAALSPEAFTEIFTFSTGPSQRRWISVRQIRSFLMGR